jgi:hypothetical protein
MRKLGEQWVEDYGTVNHMVKAVEQENPRCCEYGCDHCCFEHFYCKKSRSSDCNYGENYIIKDLGILNEDGCLPAPWDKTFYPNIYEGLLTIYTSNRRVLVCCEDDDMSMFVNGKTRQEAIDRWNRRA